MNLKGKGCLVTGAGTGIGRATAWALARKGVRLVVFGRRVGPLEHLAGTLLDAGAEAHVVAGDLSNAADRTRAIGAAAKKLGGLDLLINNAGNVRGGRLDKIGEDEIRAMMDVDLLAPLLLTREALPYLRQSGDAAIVNVASSIALIGVPFYVTYAAAKAGLARFGEALRRELLDEGVHVMTIYRLRQRFIVVSFTILSISLIVDTVRRNRLHWDAVISCEMVGVYKPRLEAYQRAARLLQLETRRDCDGGLSQLRPRRPQKHGISDLLRPPSRRVGAGGPPDPTPNPANDLVVDGFASLAERMGT